MYSNILDYVILYLSSSFVEVFYCFFKALDLLGVLRLKMAEAWGQVESRYKCQVQDTHEAKGGAGSAWQ